MGKPYIDDPDFRLHVGDVRDVLAGLPDESVHCVVTSPPYWGLRDYGTGEWEGGDEGCSHSVGGQVQDTKAPGAITTGQRPGVDASRCGKCGARRVDRQLGLEQTPDEYVANMVAVFREVRRVLRRDGTCWVNLGDSYAGGGGYAPDAPVNQRRAEGDPDAWGKFNPASREAMASRSGTGRAAVRAGLKPKDLVGIPWRVAFALQADGWYLRADIIWAKPNPMPESVTDRPTKSHEYVFLLTRSPRYFFDQEAVREPAEYPGDLGVLRSKKAADGQGPTDRASIDKRIAAGVDPRAGGAHLNGGRNVRSVWEIATQSYPDAHFATFPEELPRRCILAGTSEYGVCPECGAPWARLTEHGAVTSTGGSATGARASNMANVSPLGQDPERSAYNTGAFVAREKLTTGWRPSCGCGGPPDPVPATVLDPFLGSGTTAHVARKLGRRSIGIELNPEYAALCARRLQQLSLLA